MPAPDHPNNVLSTELSLKLQSSAQHSLAMTSSCITYAPLSDIIASPVPPTLASVPPLTCVLITGISLPRIQATSLKLTRALRACLQPCTLTPALAFPGPLLHPIATAICLAPVRALRRMSSASSYSLPTPKTLKGKPSSAAPSAAGVKSPAHAASPALDAKRSTPPQLTTVAILEVAFSGIPPRNSATTHQLKISGECLGGNAPQRTTTAPPGHPRRRSRMRPTGADLGRPRSPK